MHLECSINSCQHDPKKTGKKDSDCTDFLGYSLTGYFIKLKQKRNAFTDADGVEKTY